MGELKSAWEIAQEKADRLGKLTAEEQEQQRKERCRQAGQALVRKWFGGSQGVDIAAELDRYDEEEQVVIRQVIIDSLVEAIDFNSRAGLVRAIEGVASLEPKSQPIIERIKGLVQEYEREGGKIRRELESSSREILHELRISGTAVEGINIEGTPQWQESERRLIETLGPSLNELKGELRKLA